MVRKMDEGVKIYKSNIWPISLSFYRQLKFPLIQVLDAVLYETRKTPSINFKPSPLDFWTFDARNESIA